MQVGITDDSISTPSQIQRHFHLTPQLPCKFSLAKRTYHKTQAHQPDPAPRGW